MTPDLSARSTEAEWMDDASVGFDEFRACLVDLARVNRLTLAYRPTLAWFDRLLAQGRPDRPLEVVDVGCGYGDTLRQLDAWGARRGVPLSLTGVDMNPWSAVAAGEATGKNPRITWVTADAFAYAPPQGIDVVVSSLFTHHLPDALVVRFLRWMDAHARVGWFVNDLRRHRVPYHLFRHASRLGRFHRFVQHDGPVSIASAFVEADWRRLLAEAGLDASAVELCRSLPFRLTVGRLKCA